MNCPKCGKEVEENSDYCKHCGSKLETSEINQTPDDDSENLEKSSIIENYRKYFNMWFYGVTGFLLLTIFISAPTPADLLSNITEIILNPCTWLFYIFIFKRNYKKLYLILIAVFGMLIIISVFARIAAPFIMY